MDSLISRQAAIDAIDKAFERSNPLNGYIGAFMANAISEVRKLPSAQPIIRCKDCKYWREGTVYLYCDKLFGMGVLDAYDYMTDEDDYCSMAERRTDG